MVQTFSNSHIRKVLLSIMVGASALSYSSGTWAAQQFIEKDGVTVVDEEPAFEGPHEANAGAFEGGPTGTHLDALIDLAVPEDQQRGGAGINIPTGASPSPLFGAQPFTQKMLRFEEFGPEQLKSADSYARGGSFPRPVNPQSSPDSFALDVFLEQDIYPYPTQAALTVDEAEKLGMDANHPEVGLNPWQEDIESFLNRPLVNPPAEGRPPGLEWSHQRYEEFFPEIYFKSAQAAARTNLGLRDKKQRHQYSLGEFGPDGLYHNTVGAPGFDKTTEGIEIRLHPKMPLQEANSVFTFDGTLPPKLLSARYGEGILFRHYNALPIDPSANNGFGLHTITTHEHNGHNPAESDGYANAFFFPGQFYDYRWPVQLAGYDSINTDASDPRAAFPCSQGDEITVLGATKQCVVQNGQTAGTIQIPGDYRETMSTHWFHDHMLDFTAQNVYKGNAAMMNYYSAIDRGNESIDDGVNLRLPSGSALDWGNRDYDVNLLIAEKAWGSDGQLFFNVFNTDGFLGDRMTVNWLYKPTFEVRARRYRFRLLNGSVSRYFKIAMVTEYDEPVPFHMILNDGNIMQHAVPFNNGILPTQSIAERYDIIVDFSRYAPGTKIYMVNLMEHQDGRGPEKDAVPLSDVLSGSYQSVVEGGEWKGGDPVVGKFLELTVVAMGDAPADMSMNPADYEVGGLKMIDMPTFTDEELANATHRTFDFGRSSGTDDKPWTVKTDGGMGLNMDPRRISAAPDLNGLKDGSEVEIWHMSTGGGWSHPIHVHFEEGKVLSRDGMTPPEWEIFARKDVFRIGPEVNSSREISVAYRFREFAGTYMEHCHNTQHEDTAMLMRWDIENPGQTVLLPTPMPTWDGVGYVNSDALATFRTGDLDAKNNGIVIPTEPANGGDVDGDGVIDRIFDDEKLRAAAAPAMELDQVPDMTHILTDYIKNKDMAIALGKAFFWDQSVGSDGQACASCHFSAGADSRSKGMISPRSANADYALGNPGFDIGGVNHQLRASDYPFPKGVNDVTGSMGSFMAEMKEPALITTKEAKKAKRKGLDVCRKVIDETFSLGGLNHRQVTARNTPSVINAVFNHRNFWDGRANNMFNGIDPFGNRSNLQNPDQGIWINDEDGLRKIQVLIKNSSLASQAVGPALSDVEMACQGRLFPLLGEKLLDRTALSKQTVSGTDSVLGSMLHRGNSKNNRGNSNNTDKEGLIYKYREMIELAFQDKYWNQADPLDDGFYQVEANFSLFWGLAIQMYEATLVSNMTPYDDFARGNNNALTEQQKLGLEVFVRQDRGHCASCHSGSEFTGASVIAAAMAPDGGPFDIELERDAAPEPFQRMRMIDGGVSVYDGGFYNIGVTPTDMDLCVGSNQGGYPLSFSRQALQKADGTLIDVADLDATLDAVGDDGDFTVTGGPVAAGERVDVDGACKTPSLRNVELTAPYFHNGGHSTLEQVILSYMLKFKNLHADDNVDNLSPDIQHVDIQGLAFDGQSIRGGEIAALKSFMNALTDERVRLHQAPFDHPKLFLPNGAREKDKNKDGMADDRRLTIAAVGAAGMDKPLPKFLEE